MDEKMDSIIGRIFFNNWQRKLLAVMSAMIIWFFVDRSITEMKVIPNVPIRIINLPEDKTVVGLLPNRLLSKRVTLTLSGSKDVINEIEPGDLEVLLDVSTADSNEWVVAITKKNLVSLNPDIDLAHNVTSVSHNEFLLKLSPLITAKIPIRVLTPSGEAPSGYEFLDIWPPKLMQTINAAEEEIQLLKSKGLELVLDLSDVTKADLDAIKSPHDNKHDDEVSFVVPLKWRKVALPWQGNTLEEINDPEAQLLRIDFLRKSYIPINKEISVRVFYPIKYSATINPQTFPLTISPPLQEKNELTYLSLPLYVKDVSHLFLEIISDYLEIAVVAAPKSERERLTWSLEIIDPHELEDIYVAYLIAEAKGTNGKKRELVLRKRFREYMHRLALYRSPDVPLHVESLLETDSIKLNITKHNP